jgi:hypothetical protein
MDGKHLAWIIVEPDSKEEARLQILCRALAALNGNSVLALVPKSGKVLHFPVDYEVIPTTAK